MEKELKFEAFVFRNLFLTYCITLGGFIMIVLAPYFWFTTFFSNNDFFGINLLKTLSSYSLFVIPFLFLYIYIMVNTFNKKVFALLDEEKITIKTNGKKSICEIVNNIDFVKIERRENVKNNVAYIVKIKSKNKTLFLKSKTGEKNIQEFKDFYDTLKNIYSNKFDWKKKEVLKNKRRLVEKFIKE